MNLDFLGSLNVLDLILAGWMLLHILRGCFRGLVPELAGLAGVLLGIAVAGNQRVHAQAVSWLDAAWGRFWWNDLLTYAGVFVLVCIFVLFIFNLLNRLFTQRPLGVLDRLLGSLVGGAKGAALAGFLLSLFARLAPGNQMLKDSLLAFWLGELWAVLDRLTSGLLSVPL